MDELSDALKDLKINNAEYYESDTATTSDSQGDPTHDPKTFTHTRNRKGRVTDTINGTSKQKSLCNRTLHVVVLTMNLRINQRIAPIVVAP